MRCPTLSDISLGVGLGDARCFRPSLSSFLLLHVCQARHLSRCAHDRTDVQQLGSMTARFTQWTNPTEMVLMSTGACTTVGSTRRQLNTACTGAHCEHWCSYGHTQHAIGGGAHLRCFLRGAASSEAAVLRSRRFFLLRLCLRFFSFSLRGASSSLLKAMDESQTRLCCDTGQFDVQLHATMQTNTLAQPTFNQHMHAVMCSTFLTARAA